MFCEGRSVGADGGADLAVLFEVEDWRANLKHRFMQRACGLTSRAPKRARAAGVVVHVDLFTGKWRFGGAGQHSTARRKRLESLERYLCLSARNTPPETQSRHGVARGIPFGRVAFSSTGRVTEPADY